MTFSAESWMGLDELIFDPDTGGGEPLFSALTGVFAFVSGVIPLVPVVHLSRWQPRK